MRSTGRPAWPISLATRRLPCEPSKVRLMGASGPLCQEVEDALLVDLVADRGVVVAARDVARPGVRHQARELLCRAGDAVVGPDRDQGGRCDAGHLLLGQGLARAANAGRERLQVA